MDKLTMIPVIDNRELQEAMVNSRLSRRVSVYRGDKNDNLATENPHFHYSREIVVTSTAWKNTDRRAKLLNTIRELRHSLEVQRNANQGYDPNTIAQLVGSYYIDLVRLSDEMTDYTSILTTVFDRPDMPKDVNLRDFLPYTGKEREVSGSNDSVPLIEENTAQTILLSLTVRAFGHKNSLFDVVFNPFWDVNRLMETAANIRVDSRNDDVIGKIVRATYDAGHTQVPDATGDTRDLRIYNTVSNAYDKLTALWHPYFTTRQMGTFNPRVYLLINPMDRRKVQRVISGGLVGAGGISQIVEALPIEGIIEYGGGIQDGLPWGKETLRFPGVAQGDFYLIAVTPYGGMTFQKRDLTLETGSGSVLQLSTEERAWYRIVTTFMDWLIGKTDGKAYGGIIKGTYPN